MGDTSVSGNVCEQQLYGHHNHQLGYAACLSIHLTLQWSHAESWDHRIICNGRHLMRSLCVHRVLSSFQDQVSLTTENFSAKGVRLCRGGLTAKRLSNTSYSLNTAHVLTPWGRSAVTLSHMGWIRWDNINKLQWWQDTQLSCCKRVFSNRNSLKS